MTMVMDSQPAVPATDGLLAAHRESSLLLSELVQEFTVSMDQHRTLENALDRICQHLDAEAGSVFLLQDDQELVCSVSVGPVDLTGLHISADQGIVGRTVSSGEITMVKETGSHPDFAAEIDASTGFVTRSILCAPLMIRDTRLGAIELMNKRGGDKLFSDNDRDTLIALASATSLAIHNADMARALLEQERIQRELRLAREIQENLLPAMDRRLPVRGINIPANEVSGDFYDYFQLADDRICFCLGDVSGKGMNAALLMSKTSSLFHCLAKSIRHPGELLGLINTELCETATRGMFVTMVCGIYNPDANTVELANAGHMPPLRLQAGDRTSEIMASAPPLGILPAQQYSSHSLSLSDSLLVLYSDGISEIKISAGQTFGVAGLQDCIRKSGLASLDSVFGTIMAELNRLRPGAHDDMTLLLITGTGGTYECIEQFTVAAKPQQLKHIRRHIEQSCRACGYDRNTANNIVLAVDEACSNIIRHAYKGADNGYIHIEIGRDAENMIIQLDDDAPAVDPAERRTKDTNIDRAGGLGLVLIEKIMDATTFLPGEGNRLIMRKQLP